MSVSFLAFLQQGQRSAGRGEGVFIGQRDGRLQSSESASCASWAILVGAADAAQALAALHAVEQSLQHGAGGLAQRNHKDALVGGEIDGGRAAAVGQQTVQRIALEAQTPVEGRLRYCRPSMAPVKISVAVACRESSAVSLTGSHGSCSLSQLGERVLHRRQLAGKKVIGAGKEHQPFGFGGGWRPPAPTVCGRRKLVAVSAEEKLGKSAACAGRDSGSRGLGAAWAGRERRGRERWRALLCRWVAAGQQRHGRAKAEADGNQRDACIRFQASRGRPAHRRLRPCRRACPRSGRCRES